MSWILVNGYSDDRHLASKHLDKQGYYVWTDEANTIDLPKNWSYEAWSNRNLIEIISLLIVAEENHEGTAGYDDGYECGSNPKWPIPNLTTVVTDQVCYRRSRRRVVSVWVTKWFGPWCLRTQHRSIYYVRHQLYPAFIQKQNPPSS